MVMNLWNNLALINISAPLCDGAEPTCGAVHKSHPWALKKAKLFLKSFIMCMYKYSNNVISQT